MNTEEKITLREAIRRIKDPAYFGQEYENLVFSTLRGIGYTDDQIRAHIESAESVIDTLYDQLAERIRE